MRLSAGYLEIAAIVAGALCMVAFALGANGTIVVPLLVIPFGLLLYANWSKRT